MPLQFHQAVGNVDVWSASRADISFVITSPTGPGFHGHPGFFASWRPLYSSGGAAKVIGSPFNTFADAEEFDRLSRKGTAGGRQFESLRTWFRRCDGSASSRAGSALHDPLIQLLIHGPDRVIDLGIGQAKLMRNQALNAVTFTS